MNCRLQVALIEVTISVQRLNHSRMTKNPQRQPVILAGRELRAGVAKGFVIEDRPKNPSAGSKYRPRGIDSPEIDWASLAARVTP